MRENYTKALIASINEGISPQQALANLQTVLKKNGHEKLYRSILSKALRLLEGRRSGITTVLVARESDLQKYESAIQNILNEFNVEGDFVKEVDGTLIGGFQIDTENFRVDKTYKQKLINLYHNITN